MDRIKLEERIMDNWSTKESIETVYEYVMESEEIDRDYLANLLLGIATMHDLKSNQLFDLFDKMVREGTIKQGE